MIGDCFQPYFGGGRPRELVVRQRDHHNTLYSFPHDDMGKKPAPSTADSLSRVESEAEWTDISISDTLPLPQIPKNARFENPQFIAWSYHSQVYAVDVTIKGEQKRSILKLFPQTLANRYTNEVNAYRLLDIASTGVVPKFYADLPSITKKMLEKILRDSVPADVEIALPALGILMEYLEGGQTPSKENMTAPIAKSILEGLDYIHGARVLHGDCQPVTGVSGTGCSDSGSR